MKHIVHAAAAVVMGVSVCAAAASDPRGDSADPQRDLVALSATGTAQSLAIELESAEAWNFNAVQVLIGSSEISSSGFSANGQRFDTMVENATIYRYAGTGDDWNWTRVGEATREVQGNKLKLTVPGNWQQGGVVRVVARSLSDDWQTLFDTAPDQFSLKVTLGELAGASAAVVRDDPAKDAADAALDLRHLSVSQQQADVVVEVKTEADNNFGTLLVFFDADRNSGTGFLPPSDPNFGFEFVISGEQLLRHTGSARGDWTWSPVGSVRRTISGNVATIKFDASLLESSAVDVAAWTMNTDWQTRADRVPDSGLASVSLSPTARAPKPEVRVSEPRKNRHLSARQRVALAESYYCYYGTGQVAALSHYDVVVLHTPQMASADVKALNDLGVVTVGYISVGESEPPAPLKGDGTGPGGYASWYFDKDDDGQPDMNPIWLSYYTNANDPQWRANRVAEATRLVKEYGFDGIFLDTIDTAMANPESAPGMVQLVQDLRDALPDAPIVLNQGFPLLPQLAPISDALMLESFTATYDFASGNYLMNYPQSIDHHLMRVQKEILPVLKDHPLKVFVLDYAPEGETERIQEAANRAATFGFLFAAAPIALDAVYHTGIVGTPDAKWYEKMATPESLSLTLDRAANGFPQGTQLVPANAFAGYTVEPLVDGIADRSNMHWSKAAWASAEDGEEAWLEIRLPKPQSGSSLTIDWEPSHPSRSFVVQVRASADGPWTDAQKATGSSQRSVTIPLPGQFQAIRIVQQPDGGSTARPKLMWIAQLRLQ